MAFVHTEQRLATRDQEQTKKPQRHILDSNVWKSAESFLSALCKASSFSQGRFLTCKWVQRGILLEMWGTPPAWVPGVPYLSDQEGTLLHTTQEQVGTRARPVSLARCNP